MNDRKAESGTQGGGLGLRIPLLVSAIAAIIDLYLWVPGPGLLVCAALALAGFLLAGHFHHARDVRAATTFSGACIYGIAAAIIFGGVRYQVGQERLSASVLIVAVESYHDRQAEWPADLDALVPRYMERIPPVSLRPGHRFELAHEPPQILLRWSGTLPGSRYEYEFILGQTQEQKPLAGGLADFFRPHWLAARDSD